MKDSPKPLVSIVRLLLLGFPYAAQGEVVPYCPLPEPSPILASQVADLKGEAERLEWDLEGNTLFDGDVILSDGIRQLTAHRAELDESGQQVRASGDVSLHTRLFSMTGSQFSADLEAKTARIDFAEYRFYDTGSHGAAEAIELDGQRQQVRLRSASYTTCAPGDEAWRLQAGRIRLDREQGWGQAENLRLYVQNVPVFYFPYLSFPLDDRRKTGWLFPVVGYSNLHGLDMSLPFYWNLAPNYDATLTPRYMAERGTQLQTEFRYLTRLGEGMLNLEYLNDQSPNYTQEEPRLLGRWQHQHLIDGWELDLDYAEVSDVDYLHDLGNSASLSDTNRLRREAVLRYRESLWEFNSTIADYQILDGSQEPFTQVPALNFRGYLPNAWQGLQLFLDSDLSQFGGGQDYSGVRFDTHTGAAWPLIGEGYYLLPRLSYRFSHYQQSLDENRIATDSRLQARAGRVVPTFSLDSSMRLERDLRWKNSAYTQTLEPRLFYLRVPYRQQDDIGLYDTTEVTPDYDSLFRENRFVGRDRVGDAEQISLGVSSRFIRGESGRERLRLRLARAFYLREQKVQLDPGLVPDRTSASPYVSEVGLQVSDDWWVSQEWQWDPAQDQTSQAALRLQYQPKSDDRLLSLTHRFRRLEQQEPLEQLQLGAVWPLRDRWRLFGRWQTDLVSHSTIDSFLGLEYDDCCWQVRTLYRRYLDTSPSDLATARQDYTNGIYVQFVLKGLSSIGNRRIDGLLDESIHGYQDLRP